MSYTVGSVAEMSGVTVRTLHHYDEIGLLSPSGRSDAGYRLYGEADLERLQHVLFYRELGFGLDEIAAMLDAPRTDHQRHFVRQHRMLRKRVERLRRMIGALEKAMEARKVDIPMTDEDRREIFGSFNPEDHEAEAEERWGDMDEFTESQRRTAEFSKADWKRIKAEATEIESALAAAMAAGHPPESEQAMDLAERHRRHIGNFYECSHAMHVGLGTMYVDDPRFTEHYENVADGLAVYLRDAIHANAARAAS